MAFVFVYRKEPVVLLPVQWFYPLNRILAFPTGIPGELQYQMISKQTKTEQKFPLREMIALWLACWTSDDCIVFLGKSVCLHSRV